MSDLLVRERPLMPEVLVTATVNDDHVLIRMPDGTSRRVDCPARSLAALLLPDWVATRVMEWSGGQQTAVPVRATDASRRPLPVGARTRADEDRDLRRGPFASLGDILSANAQVETYSFSLRPATSLQPA